MKARMIRWTVMAALVSYLALPELAAQGAESQESTPRTSPDHRRPDGEQRWKKLDRDNDGRISRSEWPRNEQGFDRMDADKDGFLTKEELRSAAREFHEKRGSRLRQMDTDADGNISRGEWKGKEEIFNRLDANKDGVLTRDELREARRQHRSRSPRPNQGDKTTL